MAERTRKTYMERDDKLDALLREHLRARFGDEPQTMQTTLNVAWTLLTYAALAWDKATETDSHVEAEAGFLNKAERALRQVIGRFSGGPKA